MENAERDFNINTIAQTFKANADRAYGLYAPWVEETVAGGVRSVRDIEFLLDHILNFCFDQRMVELFRMLCRYYYDIGQRATTRYVHAYRELWDEQSSK